MVAKPRGKWNPSQHPRDSRGRFTKSATRVLKPGDGARAKAAMQGFRPANQRGGAGLAAGPELLSTVGGGTTPDEAMRVYLADGWKGTNKRLRSEKGAADGPDIQALDANFKPLEEDLFLERRVPLSMFAHIPVGELEGMKVRDAAYAASKLDGADGEAPDGMVTLHVATPAGTPAFVNAADGEVLLGRDTEIAISQAVSNGRGGWDLYGTVIPARGTTRPEKGLDGREDRDPQTAGGNERMDPAAGSNTPSTGGEKADSPTAGGRASRAGKATAGAQADPARDATQDTSGKSTGSKDGGDAEKTAPTRRASRTAKQADDKADTAEGLDAGRTETGAAAGEEDGAEPVDSEVSEGGQTYQISTWQRRFNTITNRDERYNEKTITVIGRDALRQELDAQGLSGALQRNEAGRHQFRSSFVTWEPIAAPGEDLPAAAAPNRPADESALAKLSPADQTRVALGVEDYGPGIFQSPMTRGRFEDVGRYVSESGLSRKVNQDVTTSTLWDAVEEYARTHPEILARTPDQVKQRQADREQEMTRLGAEAATLTKDRKYEQALQLIEQGEAIDPDHRHRGRRTWDEMRVLVANFKTMNGDKKAPASDTDSSAADVVNRPDAPDPVDAEVVPDSSRPILVRDLQVDEYVTVTGLDRDGNERTLTGYAAKPDRTSDGVRVAIWDYPGNAGNRVFLRVPDTATAAPAQEPEAPDVVLWQRPRNGGSGSGMPVYQPTQADIDNGTVVRDPRREESTRRRIASLVAGGRALKKMHAEAVPFKDDNGQVIGAAEPRPDGTWDARLGIDNRTAPLLMGYSSPDEAESAVRDFFKLPQKPGAAEAGSNTAERNQPTSDTWEGHGNPDRALYFGHGTRPRPNGEPVTVERRGADILVSGDRTAARISAGDRLWISAIPDPNNTTVQPETAAGDPLNAAAAHPRRGTWLDLGSPGKGVWFGTGTTADDTGQRVQVRSTGRKNGIIIRSDTPEQKELARLAPGDQLWFAADADDSSRAGGRLPDGSFPPDGTPADQGAQDGDVPDARQLDAMLWALNVGEGRLPGSAKLVRKQLTKRGWSDANGNLTPDGYAAARRANPTRYRDATVNNPDQGRIPGGPVTITIPRKRPAVEEPKGPQEAPNYGADLPAAPPMPEPSGPIPDTDPAVSAVITRKARHWSMYKSMAGLPPMAKALRHYNQAVTLVRWGSVDGNGNLVDDQDRNVGQISADVPQPAEGEAGWVVVNTNQHGPIRVYRPGSRPAWMAVADDETGDGYTVSQWRGKWFLAPPNSYNHDEFDSKGDALAALTELRANRPMMRALRPTMDTKRFEALTGPAELRVGDLFTGSPDGSNQHHVTGIRPLSNGGAMVEHDGPSKHLLVLASSKVWRVKTQPADTPDETPESTAGTSAPDGVPADVAANLGDPITETRADGTEVTRYPAQSVPELAQTEQIDGVDYQVVRLPTVTVDADGQPVFGYDDQYTVLPVGADLNPVQVNRNPDGSSFGLGVWPAKPRDRISTGATPAAALAAAREAVELERLRTEHGRAAKAAAAPMAFTDFKKLPADVGIEPGDIVAVKHAQKYRHGVAVRTSDGQIAVLVARDVNDWPSLVRGNPGTQVRLVRTDRQVDLPEQQAAVPGAKVRRRKPRVAEKAALTKALRDYDGRVFADEQDMRDMSAQGWITPDGAVTAAGLEIVRREYADDTYQHNAGFRDRLADYDPERAATDVTTASAAARAAGFSPVEERQIIDGRDIMRDSGVALADGDTRFRAVKSGMNPTVDVYDDDGRKVGTIDFGPLNNTVIPVNGRPARYDNIRVDEALAHLEGGWPAVRALRERKNAPEYTVGQTVAWQDRDGNTVVGQVENVRTTTYQDRTEHTYDVRDRAGGLSSHGSGGLSPSNDDGMVDTPAGPGRMVYVTSATVKRGGVLMFGDVPGEVLSSRKLDRYGSEQTEIRYRTPDGKRWTRQFSPYRRMTYVAPADRTGDGPVNLPPADPYAAAMAELADERATAEQARASSIGRPMFDLPPNVAALSPSERQAATEGRNFARTHGLDVTDQDTRFRLRRPSTIDSEVLNVYDDNGQPLGSLWPQRRYGDGVDRWRVEYPSGPSRYFDNAPDAFAALHEETDTPSTAGSSAPSTPAASAGDGMSGGQMEAFSPLDRQRIRIAVEDNAGRINQVPHMSGPGNVARYVAEGKQLRDRFLEGPTPKTTLAELTRAVRQVIDANPDLLARTDTDMDAARQARQADAKTAAYEALGLADAGDRAGALAALDRGENIDPDWRFANRGPGLSWSELRDTVRDHTADPDTDDGGPDTQDDVDAGPDEFDDVAAGTGLDGDGGPDAPAVPDTAAARADADAMERAVRELPAHQVWAAGTTVTVTDPADEDDWSGSIGAYYGDGFYRVQREDGSSSFVPAEDITPTDPDAGNSALGTMTPAGRVGYQSVTRQVEPLALISGGQTEPDDPFAAPTTPAVPAVPAAPAAPAVPAVPVASGIDLSRIETDDQVRVAGQWATVTAIQPGGKQFRVRFPGDRFAVVNGVDIRQHDPKVVEEDLFGGSRTFAGGARSGLGIGERATVGRTPGVAMVQQLGMFDASEQRQLEGQAAMLDMFMQMPAAPLPDSTAPTLDVDAPEPERGILPADLPGLTDEQLAGVMQDTFAADEDGLFQFDAVAAAQAVVEVDRRTAAMDAVAARVPDDLGVLSHEEVIGLYMSLTTTTGPIRQDLVDRVGAHLDALEEEYHTGQADFDAKVALINRDPGSYDDSDDSNEILRALNTAHELGDDEAIRRIDDELVRRFDAAMDAEDARIEAERVAAVAAAEAETRRIAAEQAAAARSAQSEQMAIAQAAGVVPTFVRSDALRAIEVLGDDTARQIIGDVEDVQSFQPTPEQTARLVHAAAGVEAAKEFEDLSDLALMNIFIAGRFGADDQPRAKRAGRERSRRDLVEKAGDKTREFTIVRDDILHRDVTQLTDDQLAVAPALIGAMYGPDGETAFRDRLPAINAEVARRQAVAAERQERYAAGPDGPARIVSPLIAMSLLEGEVNRGGWQEKEAKERLRRAKLAVYGLPADTTDADIRKAAGKDPRGLPDQQRLILAWYRHFAEFEVTEPTNGYRRPDWVRGPADDPDFQEPMPALPPANIAKPGEVWDRMTKQAVEDKRNGDNAGAVRYTMARARAFGIAFDSSARTDADMRALQDRMAFADRHDPRTALQQYAAFVAEWRRLALEEGVDPNDTVRFGPPDRGSLAEKGKKVRMAGNQWRAVTPDTEARVAALVGDGMDPMQAMAEVYDLDTAAMRQEEADAVVRQEFPGMSLHEAYKALYYLYVDEAVTAAEENSTTNGYLLNKAGKAAGVSVESLFMGPHATAMKYASEELKVWWARNPPPRMTLTEFKESLRGDVGVYQRLLQKGGNEYA